MTTCFANPFLLMTFLNPDRIGKGGEWIGYDGYGDSDLWGGWGNMDPYNRQRTPSPMGGYRDTYYTGNIDGGF